MGGVQGFEGCGRVNGRKRFFRADMLGLLLKVRVLPANTPEVTVAMATIEGLIRAFCV